jgi:hypothetical protein
MTDVDHYRELGFGIFWVRRANQKRFTIIALSDSESTDKPHGPPAASDLSKDMLAPLLSCPVEDPIFF